VEVHLERAERLVRLAEERLVVRLPLFCHLLGPAHVARVPYAVETYTTLPRSFTGGG
jgi:hypothetical protein